MRRSLQHLGFTQVFDAKDPVEALSVAANQRVHLIISDYFMLRMDGGDLAVAGEKGSIRGGPGVELLGGGVEAGVLTRAAEASVESFIRKPYSILDSQQRLGAPRRRRTGSPVDWGALV
jgi:CheY-like chemotaxis protein